MKDLISSGAIVYLILGIIAFEALIVLALKALRRWHLPAFGIVMNLAAGAALLLALRSVLTDAGWMVTGAWLAAAFVAHLADLVDRIRATRRACDH